jgi:uncharacterized membrane protein
MLEKVTTTPAELCCCSEKDFIGVFFKLLVILSLYLMHTVCVVFYQHLAVGIGESYKKRTETQKSCCEDSQFFK